MKIINKVIAYSVSSLWLSVLIVIGINFNFLLHNFFWNVLLILCLPAGIIIESFYSSFYFLIKKIISKFQFLQWTHKLACKFYPDYKKNYNNFKNCCFINENSYQTLLSENNIIRNIWMSSFIGLIFLIISYSAGINSGFIDNIKILIWLPILLPFMWFANIRTEILLKKMKSIIYENTNKDSD